jgi:putative glutamine amidotransferase
MRTNPIIGITTGRTLDEDGYPRLVLGEAYSIAVQSAGGQRDLPLGLPVLIPPGFPPDQLDGLLDTLDGILFSGGGDMQPSWYGSKLHPLVTGIESTRDCLELELFRKSVERELPVLGICRGLQLFNVAMGGTLYEDLADQFSLDINHDQSTGHPRDFVAHPVELTPGSHLASVLDIPHTGVNSLHHQGIRKLAPGLVPCAHSSDGLIEGVEMPAYPFGVAVQWHPECLLDSPPAQRLFMAFLDAATGYRGQR